MINTFQVRDKSQYEGGWETHTVSSKDMCGMSEEAEDRDSDICKVQVIRDWGGMALIFLGFFISGIGTSFFYSFGIPYIDDNVSKRNSPMALSFIMAGRVMGPALGYLLGSAALKVYVVPGGQGSLEEGESGWLGAWWLGFIVISIMTLIFAPLLALFPERLPTEEDTEAKRLEQKKIEVPQSARDYVMETINCGKRLLKNKVYVFNSLSTIAFLFGVVGFGTFVPKYFEYHFRRSTSSSGSSGGMSKALGSVVGILISGAVLTKFRFRSRVVAAWNVVLSALGVAFFIIMSFIACPRLEISGLASGYGSPAATTATTLDLKQTGCQASCHCSASAFSPTCSSDGVSVFFSPCHAGCSEVKRENVTISGRRVERKVYSSCSCLQNEEANITSPWWIDAKDDDNNSPVVIAAKSSSQGLDQV